MPTTKLIPGFAKNMAQKFAASAEYIAHMMIRDEIPVFKADLIEATIEPEPLNIERNRILVGYVSKNYKNLMDEYPNIKMVNADLVFNFNPEEQNITVTIISSTGQSWTGTEQYKYTSIGGLFYYDARDDGGANT